MRNLNLTTRYTPLLLPGGLALHNRVVVPPMASSTADPEGRATDATLAHYARLARSGAGLVFVEYTYVHDTGKSEEGQLGIHSDDHIAGLQKIAGLIRASGGVPGIQLTHSGGKSERKFTGGVLMGPSGITVPVKDRTLEKPEIMSKGDIFLWKSAFVAAASRAKMAGFSIVELHAAHGYGLNQWLSPVTNERRDEYGGSFENRTRLLVEIIREIKFAEPDLILSVRMPGQDFFERGMSPEESENLALLLESVGVDLIDVSSGIGGWKRPRDRTGEGYLVPEASRIQKRLSIPVIGVGGIESGDYIDLSLSKGWLSLAAVGRAILKDPAKWREENISTV